jgi:hypothetical protein
MFRNKEGYSAVLNLDLTNFIQSTKISFSSTASGKAGLWSNSSTKWGCTFLNDDDMKWFVGWLVDFCCSQLEHRASVKRFVSLQFLNLTHSVRLLGRVMNPSQGRYLTQTQNKDKQTSMPPVGFETTIPVFKRTKTVHALDRAATVIGTCMITCKYIEVELMQCDDYYQLTVASWWLVRPKRVTTIKQKMWF